MCTLHILYMFCLYMCCILQICNLDIYIFSFRSMTNVTLFDILLHRLMLQTIT